eukprot:jgi/Hompol1/4047/HPOL_003450-RA
MEPSKRRQAGGLDRTRTLVSKVKNFLGGQFGFNSHRKLVSSYDIMSILMDDIYQRGRHCLGIYRNSGNDEKLMADLQACGADALQRLHRYSVDDVVSTFKQYLIMPGPGMPLLPAEIALRLIRAAELETADCVLVPTFKELLEALGDDQRAMLHLTLRHWRKISDNSDINKMNAHSLATSLAPYFMLHAIGARNNVPSNHANAVNALECLIWNYDLVLPAEEEVYLSKRGSTADVTQHSLIQTGSFDRLASFAAPIEIAGDGKATAPSSTDVPKSASINDLIKMTLAAATVESAFSLVSEPSDAKLTDGKNIQPGASIDIIKGQKEHQIEQMASRMSSAAIVTAIAETIKLPDSPIVSEDNMRGDTLIQLPSAMSIASAEFYQGLIMENAQI